MPTVEETYDIPTSLFANGLDHFFIDQSFDSEIYATAIASGTDSATSVKFKQGNGVGVSAEAVEISGSAIAVTGDGNFDKEITTFKGDYGLVTVDDLSATTGTIKIKVKYGN